jgi:hypothetical protein
MVTLMTTPLGAVRQDGIAQSLTDLWQSELVIASTDRSMAQIEISDLHRLAEIPADAEQDLFARHPQGSGRYAGRLLCRALCQGAALHNRR